MSENMPDCPKCGKDRSIPVVYGKPIMIEPSTNSTALDSATLERTSDLVRSQIQALIQTYSH